MAKRSFAGGRFAFGVDGEFAGFIKKKHLATISHEPVTMEIAMGMGKPLWDWIKASWDQGFVQKNAELQACNFNHEVMASRLLDDALIEKVTIPALDGSSEEAGYFTLTIDPRIIRYEKGTGGHSLRHGGALFAESLRWLRGEHRPRTADEDHEVHAATRRRVAEIAPVLRRRGTT